MLKAPSADQATDKKAGNQQTLHAQALAGFTREPEQAAQLIANPDLPPPATFSAPDLAAWTAVANVLLNLDETLMKP